MPVEHEGGWTPEKVARLTELWADPGLSAKRIGEIMGVTKNTVLGKVHRLGLPLRFEPSPPKVKVVSGVVAAMMALRADQCRYPFGQVEEPSFRFCQQTAIEGRPYCRVHTDICYEALPRPGAIRPVWTDAMRAAARRRLLDRMARRRTGEAAD